MDKGKIIEEGTPDEVISNSSKERVREFFSKVL
jgi:ABC-type polar amino acid transport system ATPase subunit